MFVSHAYTTPLSPPLDFSLSILEGEAAVTRQAPEGTDQREIVLAGLEGDSAPLDTGRFDDQDPVIGMFTPKGVSWPKLVEIVADCRSTFVRERSSFAGTRACSSSRGLPSGSPR